MAEIFLKPRIGNPPKSNDHRRMPDCTPGAAQGKSGEAGNGRVPGRLVHASHTWGILSMASFAWD